MTIANIFEARLTRKELETQLMNCKVAYAQAKAKWFESAEECEDLKALVAQLEEEIRTLKGQRARNINV